MKRPRPRCLRPLSQPLQQRLNMYALAAGAAGVGALALGSPAEAKVVYTPVNVEIPLGGRYDLQVQPGFAEFWNDYSWVSDYTINRAVWVTQGASVLASRMLEGYLAKALGKGVHIGSQAKTWASPRCCTGGLSLVHVVLTYAATSPPIGMWADAGNRYLGLRFGSNNEFHYGWARLSIYIAPTRGDINAVLTGYAYETTANKPIIAGQTEGAEQIGDITPLLPDPSLLPAGSLGWLARGAPRPPARRTSDQTSTVAEPDRIR